MSTILTSWAVVKSKVDETHPLHRSHKGEICHLAVQGDDGHTYKTTLPCANIVDSDVLVSDDIAQLKLDVAEFENDFKANSIQVDQII